ncbi:MAG TPA: glycosyltransferase [Tepidisphaeraceae bacterium]|nr:glycosyltransferase [Tepidisphaeraceae bacterium]
MHVLYVHQNFPAQFGHIAYHLAQKPGWRCTFVSETEAGNVQGVEKVQYRRAGGATQHTHFCSRTFENAIFNCDGVYTALKARPEIQPDLIVGHSGFGSTLFLRDLYPNTPIVNLFEYFYRPRHFESDMGYRADLGWTLPEVFYLRARARNAMILLDLENCTAGYCPTEFQRSTFPETYRGKVRAIFDGIERSVYHGHDEALRPPVAKRQNRRVAGIEVPASTRIVTYVSRGFESMRGFDLFLKAAKLIYQQFPDVMFLVVGADRIAYGGDESFLPQGTSFRQWVLGQDQYNLSKFQFLGNVPPRELALMLAATDLHIYLTVPFVLSWSMMDAMSCGAVVLGSDTAPVREMIRDGENGMLADLFDVEQIAGKAVKALRDPAAFRPLGRGAEELIAQQYSVEAVLPQMIELYEQAAATPVSPG